MATLPQKGGCHPDDVAEIVLKELMDNALDTRKSTCRLSSTLAVLGPRVTVESLVIAPRIRGGMRQVFYEVALRPAAPNSVARLPMLSSSNGEQASERMGDF